MGEGGGDVWKIERGGKDAPVEVELIGEIEGGGSLPIAGEGLAELVFGSEVVTEFHEVIG